ncbi:hypothetical protein G7K_5346-t1 [Saitoella complicata NRRL Y-17804]|uniref:Endoplasmic reticulum oxidoreductin 1 n=2 Tax=Saitoella complicata (strain BCRC 22490 / CBS 7301 / JCM 7358 / NBRC 10748 / NRRL Y-17804) TaxID=698492 RepID=A0A0E9NN59_SAICN|nr:hypothetical protein G7K_5346-t1 [Saitoella complicata NRRL Y-17804]
MVNAYNALASALAAFALLSSTPRTYVSGFSFHNESSCPPKGEIPDACGASFTSVDTVNTNIAPLIHDLTTHTDFFGYYRLNLYEAKCPWISDHNALCGNRACAVETIDDEDDVPEVWRMRSLGKLEGPSARHAPVRDANTATGAREGNEYKPLGGALGPSVAEPCVVQEDGLCDRDYCIPEDEEAGSSDAVYVSLVNNPERFTGYGGPHAHSIWRAIYHENCFPSHLGRHTGCEEHEHEGEGGTGGFPGSGLGQVVMEYSKHKVARDEDDGEASREALIEEQDVCLEKRVFYRVISGMHASISTHLCWEYLDQMTGEWYPNLRCFEKRVANHTDRIENLYFNYVLVARAIAKLEKYLDTYTYCGTDSAQSSLTKEKVDKLVTAVAEAPIRFDESIMFDPRVDSSALALKEDFRTRFQNVSRLMDCVGCDKCRLWGKLQTAGYGTALKILFEYDDDESTPQPSVGSVGGLRRTELVALFNTFGRLSRSVEAVDGFRRLKRRELGLPEDEVVYIEPARDSRKKSVSTNTTEKKTVIPSWAEVKEEVRIEFHNVEEALRHIVRGWVKLPVNLWKRLIYGGEASEYFSHVEL